MTLAERYPMKMCVLARRLKKNTEVANRWITRGVRGPDGSRVRLAGVKVGGVWHTSEDAFDAFVAATTGGASPPAPAGRTPAEERRAYLAAMAEIERW